VSYRTFWGRLVYYWLGPYRIEGQDRVPKSGGLLVLANHVSVMDPPFTQLACPRRLYFMANSEVWEWAEKGSDGNPPNFGHKFARWLASFYGAFPVQTKSPDRGALKKAIELLKAGETVCIYPEGGTSQGGIQPLFAGAALIIRQAEVPVICLGINGTEKIVAHQSVHIKRARSTITGRWGLPRQFEGKAPPAEIMSWVEGELVELSGYPLAPRPEA
jgi:1-acyl-sn-glycerol-3-phosphate acyltransferase